MWWFGGTDDPTDDDSCELVAVRIDRTSRNSRRIAGDIIVQKPVEDVWAILTDYDNLAIHVPNLVESTRVNPGRSASFDPSSVQGDGSYTCRLFQKGAQKIIGFEFGASVTMDMTEVIEMDREAGEVKKIMFKCVESQFFSEFDGEWKVSTTEDPDDPSKQVSRVEYVVDVKPKGPVPVQALEWRIREDVPTNLRAVKAASIDMGLDGVLGLRDELRRGRNGAVVTPMRTSSIPSPRSRRSRPQESQADRGRRSIASVATSTRRNVGNFMTRAATVSKNTVANARQSRRNHKLAPVRVDWYEDETMGAYLNRRRGG